jgi:hypothetical protein
MASSHQYTIYRFQHTPINKLIYKSQKYTKTFNKQQVYIHNHKCKKKKKIEREKKIQPKV